MMVNFFKLSCVGIVGMVFLVGCGGGDKDAPSESVLSKYVGVWMDPCTVISPGGSIGPISERQIMTMTKIDETHLSSEFQGTRYRSTDCSGPATPVKTSISTLAYVGSKVVPQGSADMFQLTTSNGATRKDISMIKDGKFYPVGNPDQRDADGFPSNIATEYVFSQR